MTRDRAPKDVQELYDAFVERLDEVISGLVRPNTIDDLDLMISALINVATDMAVALHGDKAREELLEILEIRLVGSAKATRDEMN